MSSILRSEQRCVRYGAACRRGRHRMLHSPATCARMMKRRPALPPRNDGLANRPVPGRSTIADLLLECEGAMVVLQRADDLTCAICQRCLVGPLFDASDSETCGHQARQSASTETSPRSGYQRAGLLLKPDQARLYGKHSMNQGLIRCAAVCDIARVDVRGCTERIPIGPNRMVLQLAQRITAAPAPGTPTA